MAKNKTSNLANYMRNAYEEFFEILCDEVRKKKPRTRKEMLKQAEVLAELKNANQKVMDREFGEDPGGTIFFD